MSNEERTVITEDMAKTGIQLSLRSSILVSYKGSGIDSIDYVVVGNKEAHKELIGSAASVYEFVNTIALGPNNMAQLDPWTSIELTTEWAESYAAGVNKTPAPMYLAGHANEGTHYKMRAIPDGYVTGARVKGDKLYLRNSIPLSGTQEHIELIKQTAREIKAGMLSTSSADLIKLSIERDPVNDTATYKAMESLKGRSNAIVEYDLTGSIAEIIATNFKSGSSYVEPKNNEGASKMEDTVTATQMCISMKNQLDTGKFSIAEVEQHLGLTILTQANKLALKRLEDVENGLGKPVDAFYKEYLENEEKSFLTLKDAKIKDKFKSNDLVETATELFSLKKGSASEIDAEVERIAAFKVFATLRGNEAGNIGASFSAGGVNEVINNTVMEG